jgi:hypothetical protein
VAWGGVPLAWLLLRHTSMLRGSLVGASSGMAGLSITSIDDEPRPVWMSPLMEVKKKNVAEC